MLLTWAWLSPRQTSDVVATDNNFAPFGLEITPTNGTRRRIEYHVMPTSRDEDAAARGAAQAIQNGIRALGRALAYRYREADVQYTNTAGWFRQSSNSFGAGMQRSAHCEADFGDLQHTR